MAEGNNLPATAGDYTQVQLTQHSIQNGCITIGFLEQTPSARDTAHVPSWKKFMRDEVLQTTLKLAKKGWPDSEAKFTIWADSGLTSGLALTLQIEGVEVSDDNKKNYTHRMKQYLKKMSKAVHVEVQTAKDESSHLGGQEWREVPSPTRNSRELPNVPGNGTSQINEVQCEELFQRGLIAIVSHIVPLKQDNSVIRLYERDGHIPSALTPTIRIPLNCFRTCIPVFLPQCSFQPYVIRWPTVPRHRINWMIATPDLPGCETGLIPFLFESNTERLFLTITHPWTERVRVNPPEVNQRVLLSSLRIQARDAVLSASSSSSAPSIGPRIVNSFDNFPPLPPGRAEEINEGLNMDMLASSHNTLATSDLVHQLRTPAEASFQAPSTSNNERQLPHYASASTPTARFFSRLSPSSVEYPENDA